MRRLTFYLLGYKGYRVLEWLVKNDYHVKSTIKVVLGNDKNIENDYSLQIRQLCHQHNISLILRQDCAGDELSSSCFGVAIGWRWLIKNFYNNLLVIHDSLLPEGRGFSPLVNALISGEKKIGASLIFAAEEYDKGDIVFQKSVEIAYPIKYFDALKKMADIYIEVIIEFLHSVLNNVELPRRKQDESKSSYSLWRDEDDYFIDWSQSAEEILRTVNALSYPFPGARTIVEDKTIIISEASVLEEVSISIRTPGKVLFIQDGDPCIVCGNGIIRVQKATNYHTGKSILPLKKFRIRFGGKSS